MHQVRLIRLRAIIKDMQLLYLFKALVHIIKLQRILIQSQVAHFHRIRATNILIVGQHHAFHTDVDGFLRGIADDSSLMVEMSQLTSVVRHLNLKIVTCSNLLTGKVNAGTITVRSYLRYLQVTMALVLKFKSGCDWHLIARPSDIDNHFLCLQLLRTRR